MVDNNHEFPSFKKMLKSEAKGASVYTFSTFLLQLGNFLIVPLFWQKLTLEDYGILAIIEMITAFLALYLGLQLDFSITRFYYEWTQEERKYNVGTLWLVSWISTIVLGVVSIYLFSFINSLLFNEVSFYPIIFLGLIYVVIGRLTLIPYATIRIANIPVLYAAYSILSFIVRIILNIYFVLILDKKLYGLFVSNIISNSFTVILGAIIMFRFAIPCIKYNTLKESLKFSLPLIPSNLISSFTNFIDRYLLQKYASIEVLGVYSVSLKFTNLIVQFHSALKTSFVPYMLNVIQKDKEWGIKMIEKMRFYYLIILLIVSLAIAVYIKDFVYMTNRAEYFPVISWIPWLIGPTLISSLVIYFAPGLFLSKRSDLTWIPSIIQMIFVLGLGIILISKYEILGVVITRYASALSLFIATFILGEKLYSVPLRWFKFSFLLLFMTAIILLSKLLWFKNLFVDFAYNTFLIVIFGLGAMFVVAGLHKISNYINDQDFKMIKYLRNKYYDTF